MINDNHFSPIGLQEFLLNHGMIVLLDILTLSVYYFLFSFLNRLLTFLINVINAKKGSELKLFTMRQREYKLV